MAAAGPNHPLLALPQEAPDGVFRGQRGRQHRYRCLFYVGRCPVGVLRRPCLSALPSSPPAIPMTSVALLSLSPSTGISWASLPASTPQSFPLPWLPFLLLSPSDVLVIPCLGTLLPHVRACCRAVGCAGIPALRLPSLPFCPRMQLATPLRPPPGPFPSARRGPLLARGTVPFRCDHTLTLRHPGMSRRSPACSKSPLPEDGEPHPAGQRPPGARALEPRPSWAIGNFQGALLPSRIPRPGAHPPLPLGTTPCPSLPAARSASSARGPAPALTTPPARCPLCATCPRAPPPPPPPPGPPSASPSLGSVSLYP